MKTRFSSRFIPCLLLALLLTTTDSAFAQRQQLPDRQKIISVLAAQQAAWNRGDIEEFMEGYWKSDSLTFVGSKGITKGWNKTLANYKKSYPDKATMGTLTFDIVRIEMLSNAAYVLGKWHLKRKKGDVGGHFSLLWKKIDGRWVIVSDHSS